LVRALGIRACDAVEAGRSIASCTATEHDARRSRYLHLSHWPPIVQSAQLAELLVE
jgi:hypothetical protein